MTAAANVVSTPRPYAGGTSTMAGRTYAALSHLEQFYPGLEVWYWTKVVPGFGDGSRRLFLQEHGDGSVAGVVIAKRFGDERKLCTVWTDGSSAGQGMGQRLMRRAMSWLGTERPLISVPEERMPEFRTVLSRWEFSLEHVAKGHYRPGRDEYVFNGRLC